MHWGEDDEDDSSEEDEQTTIEQTTHLKKDTETSPISNTPPDVPETTTNTTTYTTPTNTVQSTSTGTLSQSRSRTASVENLYHSLEPTKAELSSFVDKHGPFAGTMMATAKPMSRVLREKLTELLSEQEKLLERIGGQRKNMRELPQMTEIISVMERVPKYEKKLLWIKGSMQRTQTMVDQLKKQSLSLQAQVQRDVVKAAEKKRAERREDEL
jgi:chromosome segregation ATPase